MENQGKEMADEVIEAVTEKVQSEIMSAIEEKTSYNHNSSSKSTDNVLDIVKVLDAFESTKEYSPLLKSTVKDIGGDVEKFLKGEMSRADMMEAFVDKSEVYIRKTVEKIATGLAATQCGNLAPAVGAVAGYVAGNLYREIAAPFVNAAKKAQYARERYEKLHGLYEESIKKMRQQRQLFVIETQNLFRRRQALLDDCFKKLDSALSVNDVDQASVALNSIANEFGGNLKFKNFNEFDDFFSNSNEKLIL